MSSKPTLKRGSCGEWDLEIPATLAPTRADAYEVPDDTDSNLIGMYGLTTWPTWQEAVDALLEWAAELRTGTEAIRR